MYVANLLSAAAARNKFRFDYNNIGRLIRAVQSIRFTPTLCWGERETTSRLTKSPLTSRRWGCEAYFIFEEEEEEGHGGKRKEINIWCVYGGGRRQEELSEEEESETDAEWKEKEERRDYQDYSACIVFCLSKDVLF